MVGSRVSDSAVSERERVPNVLLLLIPPGPQPLVFAFLGADLKLSAFRVGGDRTC